MKIIFFLIFILFLTACSTSISSFEECVAAGFPIMESYPRQCAVPNEKTFVSQSDVDEIKKRNNA